MTRFLFLVSAALFFPVAVTAQTTRPLKAMAADAGIFEVADPMPVCITPQSTTAPVSTGPVTVAVPPGRLISFCAQSNGLKTAFRLQVTDPLRTGAYIHLLDSGGIKVNGNFTITLPSNQSRSFDPYSALISVTQFGATLTPGTQNSLNADDFQFDGTSFAFSFNNADIGNEGQPAQVALYLYTNINGDSTDFFPSSGYATVPSTLSVSLSPATGTILYNIPGQPTNVQLIAGVSSTLAQSEVSFTWLVNGNNVTAAFNSIGIPGFWPILAAPVGQPILQQFTQRVPYPLSSVRQPTTFRVMVFSPSGVAYDDVVYSAQSIVELPSLPSANVSIPH